MRGCRSFATARAAVDPPPDRAAVGAQALAQPGGGGLADGPVADGHSVPLRGGGDAHLPIEDILEHRGRVTLERVAIAPAACRPELEAVARRHDEVELRVDAHLAPVRPTEHGAWGRRGLAAVDAPRGRVVALAA